MLIAIHGKKGHGKDTVTKIIQGLLLAQEKNKKNPDYLWIEQFHSGSNIINVKFADKIKDIVCMLIGCSRDMLENRDFKEKELSEEWWYFRLSKVDRVTGEVNTYMRDYLSHQEYLEDEMQSMMLEDGVNCEVIKLTPRLLTTSIGTDGGTQIVHPNMWVNATFSRYKETAYVKYSTSGTREPMVHKPQWIISDLRFPNELRAVRERDGNVISVVNDRLEIPDKQHISETALDDFNQWDAVIKNNGSLNDLVGEVQEVLLQFGLLKYP